MVDLETLFRISESDFDKSLSGLVLSRRVGETLLITNHFWLMLNAVSSERNGHVSLWRALGNTPFGNPHQLTMQEGRQYNFVATECFSIAPVSMAGSRVRFKLNIPKTVLVQRGELVPEDNRRLLRLAEIHG